MSGEEFAEALGLEGKNRRSTINNWESGANNVKADDIENICRKFNVSADWLLGIADENNYTNDETIKLISDYTGLSTEAVRHLHYYAREQKPLQEYLEILGEMLSDAEFYQTMAFLVRAKRIEMKDEEARKLNPDAYDQMQGLFEYVADTAIMSDKNKDGRNGIRLNLRQSVEFYLLQAAECFKKEAEQLVKGGGK